LSFSRHPVFLAFTFALLARPVAAETFQSAAPIALVQDYESGAILYEKNADQPMIPAQTVKLMTAELVFNEIREGRLHLDDMYTVSENAWRVGGAHGHSTAMFLDVKSQVRVEDLIRGMAIQSGNDAALVFAEGIAGSEDAFVISMNKRAEAIGLSHTRFANAYGKFDPDQKTTARDMATLAAHLIREFPDEYKYFGEKDFTWNKIHQLNRDPLLTMGIGADGVMAGDTSEGGYGVVGSAVEDGQRLIVVMNGVKTATERAEEARKLIGFGFRAFDPRVLFRPGDTVGSAAVYGGASGRVELTCSEAAKVFVPHGSTDRLLAKVVYTGPLVAPVSEGVEVARLQIWRGATLSLDIPLKTKASVAEGSLARRAFDALIEVAQDWVRRLWKPQA
jgi:serine-type D-Ala-D-Ala carboxypeptidase (penicillin-binding protein 5/6)